MRDILFIGKSSVTDEWVEGNYMKMEIGGKLVDCIVPYGAFVDNLIGKSICQVDAGSACQYTGMKDKNGAKIFEHDIISAHLDDLFPENETRLVVVWHDYGFFGINPRYIDYTQYQIDLITMITSKQSEMKDVLFDSLENEFVKKFEIIGNIYDNPELLK